MFFRQKEVIIIIKKFLKYFFKSRKRYLNFIQRSKILISTVVVYSKKYNLKFRFYNTKLKKTVGTLVNIINLLLLSFPRD